MTIAAFDFDGTITTKDTMFAFIRFAKGTLPFFGGMFCIAPTLVAHKLGWVSAQKAKEKLLTFFFKNETEDKMYVLGNSFCQEKMPQLIRKEALLCIKNHQKQGHICYLVTASLPFWTKKWAEQQAFVLLATQPEIIDGKFTGKISGKNCNADEKVNRLEAILSLQKIDKKYAYGDTAGDLTLLKWADESYFKPFR